MISAVVFDVGECLVDETREYGTWADWLGVPRHTFSSVFGATIARGLDYRDTFTVFRKDFNLHDERERRAEAGQPEFFDESDLYPDVRPALQALRDDGIWVGIAGNQTLRAGRILRSLDLPCDWIAVSDELGAEKPDTEFFREIARRIPAAAEATIYVGDRLDNDIEPASRAGFRTGLIRRGPWATIQLDDPRAEDLPDVRMNSLIELAEHVTRINAAES